MAFFCYLSALPGNLPVGGGYPRGAQPAHLEPHHGQDRARRAPRHPGRPQRAEGAHRGHQADQGQVRISLIRKNIFCFKKIFITSDKYNLTLSRYELYEMTLQVEEFQNEMEACNQCQNPAK